MVRQLRTTLRRANYTAPSKRRRAEDERCLPCEIYSAADQPGARGSLSAPAGNVLRAVRAIGLGEPGQRDRISSASPSNSQEDRDAPGL